MDSKITRLVLSLLIFAILIWWIGAWDIVGTISKMNPLSLIPAFLIVISKILLTSANLKLLLDQVKKIPFRLFFRHYISSWLASLFLPGRIGDFSLSFFLSKEGIKIGESTSVVFLDRAITILIFTIFALFGLILFLPSQAYYYIAILLIFWVSASIIFLSRPGRSLVRKLLTRRFESKFQGFSKSLFSFIRDKKKYLALNLLLSILVLSLTALTDILLLASVSQPVPFLPLVIMISITTLISSIPVTFNGIGLREASYVFLLGLIGIPAPAVVTIAIASLLINYSIAAIFLALKAGKRI